MLYPLPRPGPFLPAAAWLLTHCNAHPTRAVSVPLSPPVGLQRPHAMDKGPM